MRVHAAKCIKMCACTPHQTVTIASSHAASAPQPLTMEGPAAPHLTPSLAAVSALGDRVTFRQKLREGHSESSGFAGIGGSVRGSLPVLDGEGRPVLNVRYSSSDPRLRQLDAVLTAQDGSVITEFRRPPAPGGISSLVMVTPSPCAVVIGGSAYASISSPHLGGHNVLVRAADPQRGAAVVRGPGAICCAAYTVGLASSPAGGADAAIMTVDSDSCLPMCPPCLICAFNLGQRRVCELANGDAQSRLDLLLLYTFAAVDPLTIVDSGG